MENWKFAQIIVNWQHQYGRNTLPWQKNNDPYQIWISEIMLQQTQVKTVIPYFNNFINIFKNIHDLSAANLNQILYLWSGLGYYNRAYNIYKTAKIIVNKYYGHFPTNSTNLITLPGIGLSTANAILSLSYNFSLPILDGNIKRILTRFYNLNKNNISNIQYIRILWRKIQLITPIHHAKKFNQGMMDLGSLICSYKNPKCTICPIKMSCQYTENILHHVIIAKKRKKKPKKCSFYLILQYKQYIYLKYRKNSTIWKKLFCFPEFYNIPDMQHWISHHNIHAVYSKKYYYKKHQFSHFTLKMIFIHIFLKNKIFKNNQSNIWYNQNNTQYIGIPKPIYNILCQIKNHSYNTEKNNMKLIFCQYFQKVLEGFENQFYPGLIGQKIFQNISKKAWNLWMKEQTKFINENNLNMLHPSHNKKVEKYMMHFLFLKNQK
ncbi:A/G-specific adenine glycosylase [Buchnera aphidicola (Takecallis taiwana)]|uniref:A/G-specific adenine glycosylase n=1 Tax=Buchnera aphidicola TaxID=9 RepID=UPI0031B7273F